MTEMTAFDPKAIKDRVSGSIKKQMFDLLPDDQFDKMVEEEWNAFFNEPSKKIELTRTNSSGYNSNATFEASVSCTPFRQIVWSLIVEEIKPLITKLVQSEDWKCDISRQWTDNKEDITAVTSELMEARFENMSRTLARDMFSNVMFQAVENMKMEVTNILNNKGIY